MRVFQTLFYIKRRRTLSLRSRFVKMVSQLSSAAREGSSKLERALPMVDLEGTLKSVMKVYVTSVEADYTQPWQVYMEEECTGSGFAIRLNANRLGIVTNAHVVASYADVRIRKFGEVHKYKARVLMVAHTADVALLAVDDSKFWRGVDPLEFGEVPRLYENVKVLGYPMGGDNACVTRGVVSRVDTTCYVRGAEQLLVVQIDAAINSGNSGGPALDDESRVAGVAFSGYAGSADNIGYVIPRVVVENVVRDYLALDNKGTWKGLCNLGLWTQPCENVALRRKLNMLREDLSGVLVTRVAPLGCGHAAGIRQGDVVLSIAGVEVANDGTVPLRGSERVHVDHLVTSKRRGETVDVVVLRDGKTTTLTATLAPLPRLVPICDGFDAFPHYVVVGGLVFMALSAPLLSAAAQQDDATDSDDESGGGTAGSSRYVDLLDCDKETPTTQVVVWTQTLSHDVNFGYSSLCQNLPRLKKINNVRVDSLAHLVSLTRSRADDNEQFIEFEFLPPNSTATLSVVIDRKQAASVEQSLLRRSKVPAPYSPELKQAAFPKKNNSNNNSNGRQEREKNKPEATTAPPSQAAAQGEELAAENGDSKKANRRGRGRKGRAGNKNNKENANDQKPSADTNQAAPPAPSPSPTPAAGKDSQS